MAKQLPPKTSRGLSPWFSREPFRTLQEEMDDLISRFSADWNGEPFAGMTAPSVDLSETDEALQIRMDLPGVKPEEIDVEVTGNTIRISGERKEEQEEQGKTFHRVERRSGSFARALTLPGAVEEDKVEAEYEDGVLNITLPKTEQARTRKIDVKGSIK